MTQFDYSATERILIRAVNWVGDAVMTTPAIDAIRLHFPKAQITVLANPLVGQLLSTHDSVDQVIIFDRNKTHRGIRGRLRLAAEVRKYNFDMAIILPNSFDSALVPWLAGIPVRLGKKSDGRGLLLTGSYSPAETPPLCHEAQYYLNLVQHFGIKTADIKLRLFTTADEDHAAAALLKEHGIGQEELLIGINPGATYGSAKRWYPDRFAEAAQKLADDWKAKIVIFGGQGESEIAADIEKQLSGNCLNMAGKTSIRELMALIRRCNFFITNDSGPMHIAAAFGVPLVAIFGSTDHATTSPFTDKAVIVRKEFDCAPCKLRECPTDHACMKAVTAEDVVAAAEELRNHCGLKQ